MDESSDHPRTNPVERARLALKALFAAPAPAASASAPAASAHQPDIACHCLVVDESKLGVDSSDRVQLTEALRLAGAKVALVDHVLAWLSVPHADVSVVYVMRGTRLHINFTNMDALARVLARVPFLSRCGSLAAGPWQGNLTPCGPKRHQLPEVLHFSCLPPRIMPMDQLTSAVQAMLTEANVEHTGFWFPSQFKGNAPSPARGGRDQSPRVSFYVLPRNILTLQTDIERLHKKFSLWGGSLSVHAPNTPTLQRCRQCEQLGHRDDSCPQYGGLGLRLLFKTPAPYSTLVVLVRETGAKVGYLGSGVDEFSPNHKITLLFADASEQDEESITRVLTQAGPVVAAFRSLLHCAPDIVRPKDRKNECNACGSLTRAHQCPFALGGQPAAARMHQQSQARGGAAPARVEVSRDAAAAPARAPPDSMCKSWRLRKACPRLERGEQCSFDHPPTHVPAVRTCNPYMNTGHCTRGTTCGYAHPPRVSAPPAAAPVAQASALGGAAQPAPVPSAPASSNAPAAAASMPAAAFPPPAASAAAASPTPAPSPSATSKALKRKQNGATADTTPAAASVSDSEERKTGGSSKKSKHNQPAAAAAASSLMGIPVHKTSWGDMQDDVEDMRDDDGGSGAGSTTPLRTSSLSTLPSPTKAPRPATRGTPAASPSRTPSASRQYVTE
jgi:hypothetical protein